VFSTEDGTAEAMPFPTTPYSQASALELIKENAMNTKNYAKLTPAILIAWFTFALSASAMHLFLNESQRVGLAVAFAALTPIILFAAWFAASKTFREFTLSLNPRILTYTQTWRLLGIVFVLLEARNQLPAVFALPAGYGDIFIGATASLVAWKLATPRHRSSFIVWQLLGITDLVAAVSLGTTARLIDVGGPTMLPMTILPLSLVPTFLVPLFFIIHVISIAQARKWGAASVGTARVTTLSVA
jgi:hypothetical protein